jgi:hypothetical protein
VQQNGDDPLGDVEQLGDLAVGQAFEVAQGEDLGGARREPRERQAQVGTQLAARLLALGVGGVAGERAWPEPGSSGTQPARWRERTTSSAAFTAER